MLSPTRLSALVRTVDRYNFVKYNLVKLGAVKTKVKTILFTINFAWGPNVERAAQHPVISTIQYINRRFENINFTLVYVYKFFKRRGTLTQ